jgi:hypothetical protein
MVAVTDQIGARVTGGGGRAVSWGATRVPEADEPSGSFTTYLQMLRQESERPTTLEDWSETLLELLAKRGPLTMDVWHSASGLGIVPFAEALRHLEQGGLVERADDEGPYTLTEEGRRRAPEP